MQNCLNKAIDRIPACDQVTKLTELAELTTLHKTLSAIITFTNNHHERNAGIAVLCGMEVLVKIMKTFPMCQMLQERACGTLRNFVRLQILQGESHRIGCNQSSYFRCKQSLGVCDFLRNCMLGFVKYCGRQ
jgi:K+-transporting ATPase A subunit